MPRAREMRNTQNAVWEAFFVRTPIPPPTRRQMVWKREEEYIYINIFSLFAHFRPKTSVSVCVNDLSMAIDR